MKYGRLKANSNNPAVYRVSRQARMNVRKETLILHSINHSDSSSSVWLLLWFPSFVTTSCFLWVGRGSLIHFSLKAFWLWALLWKTRTASPSSRYLKWSALLSLALICSGWHTSGLFVTQTTCHVNVSTSVHKERRMRHFAAPLYSCTGLSVKVYTETVQKNTRKAGGGRVRLKWCKVV